MTGGEGQNQYVNLADNHNSNISAQLQTNLDPANQPPAGGQPPPQQQAPASGYGYPPQQPGGAPPPGQPYYYPPPQPGQGIIFIPLLF